MKSRGIIKRLDLKGYEIEELKRMARNREEREDEEVKKYNDINFILREIGREIERMGVEVNSGGASMGERRLYRGYIKLMLEIRKEKRKEEEIMSVEEGVEYYREMRKEKEKIKEEFGEYVKEVMKKEMKVEVGEKEERVIREGFYEWMREKEEVKEYECGVDEYEGGEEVIEEFMREEIGIEIGKKEKEVAGREFNRWIAEKIAAIKQSKEEERKEYYSSS